MPVMSRAFGRWPLFAVAFAMYPVLHVAAVNPGQAEAMSVVQAVAAAVAVTTATIFLLRLWLSTWYRAGIAATWLVILFFSFGLVGAWLEFQFQPAGELQFALRGCCSTRLHTAHSIVWTALLVLGLALARRLPMENYRGTAALNLIGILLLALVSAEWLANRGGDVPVQQPADELPTIDSSAPDFYHIVLDGYARADVLLRHYRFDNSVFIDSLSRRGFSVLEESTSNYYWTDLSLSSTLNFDYLPELLGSAVGSRSTSRDGVYRLTRDNRLANFLRAHGYDFLHLESTWGATGANPYADRFLPCRSGAFSDEFLRAMAEISWLRALNSRATLDLAECHLNNFARLEAIAGQRSPKVVLVHFLLPHHPYLFDSAGKILRQAQLSSQFDFQSKLWEDRDAYIEQLRFVNSQILSAVDGILNNSIRPPVIIIQSDHGPNLRQGLTRSEQHRIRFANLTAAMLPGAPADLLPPEMTSVNLYRRVLNHYFDAQLSLLPARTYVSSFKEPFTLVEVASDGTLLVDDPKCGDNM